MINNLKKILIVLTLALGVVGIAAPVNVSAIDVWEQPCAGDNTGSTLCSSQSDDAQSIIRNVVNTLLFVLGAVSVVAIIIGGIMFAVSAGNADQIKRAKNTILYSVVGLAVAFAAYAIVNWVIERF